MPITWSRRRARAPPAQRPRQLRHARPRGRLARPPVLRGAAGAGRPLAHVDPAGFAGFSNRVGDPVALEYPTTGGGDYRIPGLTVEHADGSTVLSWPTSSTGSCRQAGLAGQPPPGDLRRGRRRGRDPHRHPRRRAQRPDRRARLHDLPRPPGHRPERPDPQRGHDADPPDRRHERDPGPPRRALGVHPAERRMGAREPRRPQRPATRPPVRRQRPRRHRATSTTRSSRSSAPTTTEEAGEVYGFSLVYSGNFLAEAEVDAVRHDPRPDRHQPEHVHLDARAGRRVPDARGRSSSTRTPGSAR